jgi:putative ABC transport system permease protein
LREGRTAADLKERIWYWADNESPFLEMVPEGVRPTEMMQPNVMAVPDIYLHAGADAGNMGDMRSLGDIRMVYAFSGIALLILVIASINFMNLSTARASRRSREVALRKVLGAKREQVALQFLGEAVTIALLALLFALVAVEMVLPLYSNAIDRELALILIDDVPLLLSLLLISVLVGLISGSYPAMYLSRFLPARILHPGHGSERGGSSRVRSILVVFQFAISIGLTVCTVVMYGQTIYARSMDLGYEVDGKLVLHGMSSSGARGQKEAILEQLLRIPQVSSVVLASEVPSQDNENNTGFQLLDAAGSGMSGDQVVLNYHSVGFDFFESYGIELLHGRSFDRQYGAEEISVIEEGDDRIGAASIVVNESAARALGFGDPSAAIGKVLRADVFQAGLHDLTIVGVSRDVYYRSIKFGIRPTVYFNNPRALRSATISFSTNDIPGLIADVEEVWKEMVPMQPVSHEFLSDMVAAQYQDQEQQAQLFAAFSILAIVIASLGLYGLASFTAERRTKEIGIRKALGARVRDIVRLLVWQFSRPVLIANLIAWPVSLYLVMQWLEGFQYRIGGGVILMACLGAGLASLAIAWITVATRAIRVARANPVEALRYE